MKITNINRRMPFSASLTRVGSTDSKAFGRTSRTYRKGGLMFTITASQSEWSEFDSNGYIHRMEMITDHLSDEDASLLYRSEATTSRGVAAVNSFLAKLDEEQEAAAAKARKAEAEKKAAKAAEDMKAAEVARQQEIAALVVATLKQCGFDPTAQQAAPAPATPQTTAPAATTTTTPPASTPADSTPPADNQLEAKVAKLSAEAKALNTELDALNKKGAAMTKEDRKRQSELLDKITKLGIQMAELIPVTGQPATEFK